MGELIVATDLSWKAQPSPVIESDIFDGETYDARIEKVVRLPEKTFHVKPIQIDMAGWRPEGRFQFVSMKRSSPWR